MGKGKFPATSEIGINSQADHDEWFESVDEDALVDALVELSRKISEKDGSVEPVQETERRDAMESPVDG